MSVGKSKANETTQNVFLGCGLAIGGNLLISISLNLQKYTHVQNERRVKQIHYTRDPLWWLGLVLMGLGEIGNFTAYGFAPASAVAPLGTTTVVANLFLAAAFLKEKLKTEHLFGCGLAIIGAFLFVTFSSKNDKVLDGNEIVAALLQTTFIVYLCIELTALIVLFVLLYKAKKEIVVVYLLITSITASFTVISAKGISSLLNLTYQGIPQWKHPVLYIMIFIMVATAIVQIKYLNLAMKKFEATVVVPTNFVFFTISAIVAGIVFYKELWGMDTLPIIMFLFGCVLSFVGVYYITCTQSFHPASKPPPSQVLPELFPSWLLASVNVGHIQPDGSGVTDESRTPILAAEHLHSSSSEDNLYSKDELSMKGIQDSSNQSGYHDGFRESGTQDGLTDPRNQDGSTDPRNQDESTDPGCQDGSSIQDGSGDLGSQSGSRKLDSQDGSTDPGVQDGSSQPCMQEVKSYGSTEDKN